MRCLCAVLALWASGCVTIGPPPPPPRAADGSQAAQCVAECGVLSGCHTACTPAEPAPR
ncbi:MAG: hypothetical protein K1X88_32055 [Nannocystaceae bacterium]|nr:hypothetical protein [Nannocystaceae bacterium]